jgi:hypothetical protein
MLKLSVICVPVTQKDTHTDKPLLVHLESWGQGVVWGRDYEKGKDLNLNIY